MSQEFMTKNSTYNIYDQNCRNYALYMFDFFLLFQTIKDAALMKKYVDLMIEIHHFSGHIDVPLHSSMKMDKQIEELKSLVKEEFSLIKSIFNI